MSKDLVEVIKVFIKHVSECPHCHNCNTLAKDLLNRLDQMVKDLKDVVD